MKYSTNLLNILYVLCASRPDTWVDPWELALTVLNQWLSKNRFSTANEFLAEADVERLNATVLVSILTITFHGKQHLSERQKFLEKAETQMVKELGQDRTAKLLETRR